MRSRRKIILIAAEALFLGFGLLAVTPSANPVSIGKITDPFKVALLRAAGQSSVSGHQKPLAIWECVTGWYGEPFDGQETANGEIYDMYGVTAAHPTLPLGSVVRIVNPRNNRSQIVRINDRGPYVEGRELDVSYEVARRLGFDESGLAKVRVELLTIPPHATSTARVGF